MKKTYKSKVEKAILLPMAMLLLVLELVMLFNQIWAGAILIVLIGLFIVYLYLDTSYELTGDDRLKVKSGFLFHREIYVKSIKRITQTRNPLTSPALSLDRLEIQYNRYDRVLISPNEKSEFISRLKQVNPRITVG